MSIIIIVSVTAALINDTIRTKRTSLVAVDTGFEDEIRGELDRPLVAVNTGFEDEIRGELDGPLVAVNTGFEDEIRGELDEGKYVILTTSSINQKDAGKEIN